MSPQPKIHVVLYQPVIPQNTGSIARMCACTASTLHLIHPLGFRTDEASVRRAGLDYWEHVDIREHHNWDAFLSAENPQQKQIFFLSKFATRPYTAVSFEPSPDLYLVFGSETKGLPEEMHQRYSETFLKIPMRTQLVRSLNLSQAAAILTYEALRQRGFAPIEGQE